MQTRRALIAALATCLLTASAPAWASGPAAPVGAVHATGSVHGIVTAQKAGLELPRVSITLRNQATGSLVRVGATDLHGAFRFDQIPEGRYSLEASHPGFQRVKLEPVLVVDGIVRREHVALPTKADEPSNHT